MQLNRISVPRNSRLSVTVLRFMGSDVGQKQWRNEVERIRSKETQQKQHFHENVYRTDVHKLCWVTPLINGIVCYQLRCSKLGSTGEQQLCTLLNFIRVIKSRKIRWARYVACVRKMKNDSLSIYDNGWYYVGYCPLFDVYLIYATFRDLPILPSSGDCTDCLYGKSRDWTRDQRWVLRSASGGLLNY
jgi:hypothetical protein